MIGENVTVTVKVKMDDPVKDMKNRNRKVLKKQEVVIGDADGCTSVVVWEDDNIIRKMEEEKCYRLTRAAVRSYNKACIGTKCGLLIKKCKTSASARVMVTDGAGKVHSLVMFDSAVKTIVGEGASDLKHALVSV